jgi:hypothetical protein
MADSEATEAPPAASNEETKEEETKTDEGGNDGDDGKPKTPKKPTTPRIGGGKKGNGATSGNTTPRIGTAASQHSHGDHKHDPNDKTLQRSRVGTAPTASSRR